MRSSPWARSPSASCWRRWTGCSSARSRIERALARRHLEPGGFVLYDLSSSYVEGRRCPLAALGYSRDGKKGKLQINYGLICSPEGRPVAVEVFAGNTQDQQTLPSAVAAVTRALRDRAGGLRRRPRHDHPGPRRDARRAGVDFISALKAPQIRKLAEAGELQLSLFDETNLAEISSSEFPGERLVVCRNPAVARERARKREDLLAATEAELEKVRAMVEGPAGRLRGADAGKIGERVGRVSNKYKVAKHFELEIADGAFAYERKTEQIEAEAALDGLYVIRTTCAADLGPAAVVRAYKQLKMAERAFRTMKTALEIRPIHHHLEDRVRAHVFLCMLAYYVAFELEARLAPLLFTDDTPLTPADPVAPAERSAGAKAKAGQAHRRRPPRPQPPRPHRRARHPLPQPGAHRARRAHLHPAHRANRAPAAGARAARRPPVAKAAPAPSAANPALARGSGPQGGKLPTRRRPAFPADAPSRIRTCGLLLRRESLYPTELSGRSTEPSDR